MANKVVSLLLNVKNKLSPGAKEASADLQKLQARSRSLERELNKLENAEKAAKGLDAARQSAVDAEKAFDKAQLEVERLKQALKSEKTPEMAVALVKARDSAREAKKEWKASAKGVTQLEKSVESAGGDLNNLGETQKRLASEIQKTSGAVQRNKQKLDSSRESLDKTEKSAAKAGKGFSSLVKKAAALVGIVAIVGKVKNAMSSLASNVFKTGKEFEAFGNLLNDQEFGYIEEFARETPMRLQDVTNAFIKMRDLGLDPTDGSLEKLVDKNEQLGGGMDRLNNVITRLGRAYGRHQITESTMLGLIQEGIPAWDMLAESMGKTVPELKKMATAGQLGRKEISLLIDVIGESADGAGTNITELSQMVTKLQDRFTLFYKEVADAGVWEYLKDQAQQLTAAIDEMASTGKLKELAQNISDGFIAAAEATKNFVTTIYSLRSELGLIAKAWLALRISSWASQLATAGKGFVSLATGAATATKAMKALAVAMRATVALAIIQGVWTLTTAYKDLKVAVADLDKAKQQEANSTAELNAKFKEISESTGVVVRNMKELDAAVENGSIVIDKQANAYLSAEQAANKFAGAQSELGTEVEALSRHNERLKASADSVSSALSIAKDDTTKLAQELKGSLTDAIDGSKFGVDDLSAALTRASLAGEDTAKSLDQGLKQALASLSDEQQTRFGQAIEAAMEKVGTGSDQAKRKVENLQSMLDTLNTTRIESAMEELGITSQAEFEKIAASAKAAFEEIRAGGAPIQDQKAAFLSYAKTAIESNKSISASARQSAIEQLKVTAATLGMEEQLQQLIGTQQQMGEQGEQAGEQVRRGTDSASDGMQELSDKTDDAKQAAGGLGSALANILNSARQQMEELSEATAALFDKSMGLKTGGVVTEVEALKSAIAGTREELSATYLTASKPDFTGVSRFINKVGMAHKTSKIAFQEQKLEALQLTAAMNEAGNITQGTINRASNAMGRLNLLGKEDLSTLRGALDSANSKLQAMNDNAKSTLDGLRNQLDRLQDNQAAIQQRDYENKRSELVNAIEDAKRMGNQEAIKQYTEALSVLEKVRNEQTKQLQKSKQEQRQREQEAAAQKQAARRQTASASKKVDIDLNLGGKKAALSAGSQSEADALIDILEKAGLSTL